MIPLRYNLDKYVQRYVYVCVYILYKWQIAKTSSSYKRHSLLRSFVRSHACLLVHNAWNVVVKVEMLIILRHHHRKDVSRVDNSDDDNDV